MALSQIKLFAGVSALQLPAAPAGGAVLQELIASDLLSDGVGDFQADRVVHKTYTIAGSGSQSVDLTTVTDVNGTAAAFAEVVAFHVANHAFLSDGVSASGGSVKISPNASNGWTSWLDTAAASVLVPPGGVSANQAPRTGWAVGASNKVIDLDNSNSGSVYVTVYVLGRSA